MFRLSAMYTALAACSLSLSLSACGSDANPSAPAGDEALSQVEVAAFMGTLEGLGTFGTSDLESGGAEQSVPCPLGGDVLLSGSASQVDEDTFSFDITLQHRGCKASSDGRTFTLNGAPNVRQKGTFSIAGFLESIAIDIELDGTIDWDLDGRSGSCVLDLEVFVQGDESGSNGSVSGTVCGVDYSESITG